MRVLNISYLIRRHPRVQQTCSCWCRFVHWASVSVCGGGDCFTREKSCNFQKQPFTFVCGPSQFHTVVNTDQGPMRLRYSGQHRRPLFICSFSQWPGGARCPSIEVMFFGWRVELNASDADKRLSVGNAVNVDHKPGETHNAGFYSFFSKNSQ